MLTRFLVSKKRSCKPLSLELHIAKVKLSELTASQCGEVRSGTSTRGSGLTSSDFIAANKLTSEKTYPEKKNLTRMQNSTISCAYIRANIMISLCFPANLILILEEHTINQSCDPGYISTLQAQCFIQSCYYTCKHFKHILMSRVTQGI